MEEQTRDKIIEVLFLIALFGSMIYFVNATLYDHKITHTLPQSYFASDAFAYLFLSQHAYEVGNQKYHPFYSAGGYHDVIWIHGILVYGLAAIFARTAGIEVYDSLYFIATIMVALGALAIYLIIGEYNKKVAMLSAGFFAFFVTKYFYYTYLWGQLGAVSGMFFLIAMVWSIQKRDVKKAYLLMILFFVATLLAHMPEFIFGVGFIFFFFISKMIIERTIGKKMLKNLFIALLITACITAYYLVIFKYGMYETQGKGTSFIVTPEQIGSALKIALFSDFGNIFIPLIILGIMACVYALFSTKKAIFPLLMGLFFLILGFSNYFGMGYRAFHVRAYWPFFIAPIFGAAIYSILRLIKKTNIFIILILSIACFSFIIYENYTPIYGPGMINQYQWNAFKWLKENTAESDRIFFFYGDTYDQNARLVPRLSYVINTQDYAESINNQTLKRQYLAELLTLHNGNLMYWKENFKLGYHTIEDNLTFKKPEDICAFNYYVFDKQSAYMPGLAEANVKIKDLLLNKSMKLVYSNDLLDILKNNAVGSDCLG